MDYIFNETFLHFFSPFAVLSGFLAGLTLSEDIFGQVSPDCITFLFCILSSDSGFPHI